MKKYLIGAIVAGLMTTSAGANGLEEYCVAYTTENGGDPSGCSCLAEASDDAMAEEMMAVESEADFELLSDASKEAIQACFPDA